MKPRTKISKIFDSNVIVAKCDVIIYLQGFTGIMEINTKLGLGLLIRIAVRKMPDLRKTRYSLLNIRKSRTKL